jgi:hypothetical protein
MDHTKLSNSAFKELLNNIFTKANGNEAEFFLTPALVGQVKTSRDTIDIKIADQTAKLAAAKASTTDLGLTRKEGNALISLVKRTMKSNANFSLAKYVEFGFDEDDLTPSAITPETVLDLSAKGASNGTNTLKFNRNGNKPGTIFLIEAKIGDAPDYIIVGTTTKTTFEHKGQKPGVKVVYRVRAQRGDDVSEPSNEAVVYE